MKLETLKSFKLKKLIIPVVIVLCLIIVVTTFTSKSKYVYVDSIPIIDGTVNYTPYKYKIIKQYKQKDTCTDTSSSTCYEEVSEAPTTGYELNEEKTYYYVDYEAEKVTGAITLNADGSINADNLPMRSKCFLYFDKEKAPSTKSYEQLLALNKDLTSKGNNAHFPGTSCDEICVSNGWGGCSSGCTYQENGVYEAPDDDGTSYYFRGTVENNYVKFGKMGKDNTGEDIWWRIIRINGDGSIRMIFAGTGTGNNAPTQTGSGTTIGSSAFNNSKDRAEYVGFEYELGLRNGNSKDTSGQKSNALQTLESWFKANLEDEFGDGINTPIDANAGFCADRTVTSGTGVGTSETYYAPYTRTTSTHQPTFKCTDKDHDLFTYTGSNQGTKTLTYPIGLTTIDEQVYAGNHWSGSNTKYYLYNKTTYWTMSPYYFDGSNAYVFNVLDIGYLNFDIVHNSGGLRPVLNLKSEYLTTGSGVSNIPFSTS